VVPGVSVTQHRHSSLDEEPGSRSILAEEKCPALQTIYSCCKVSLSILLLDLIHINEPISNRPVSDITGGSVHPDVMLIVLKLPAL